ncbi:hypothetical protein PPTG_23982 [Phytophthora nicotianae INRA-310]|uniref:Uncharacterized protein n=1 Tax=Phytophthora nicotianae (strain INRA-310) TaxID=761204 RepID=W2PMQ9_PHYN3|nr:hypothetical protein PPTG_23982 [Phytophthora nicotianae INRA-310]ETN01906.1 hypothetical protein PPTG_23982 [Phytophthora nicotianae INRA-310]
MEGGTSGPTHYSFSYCSCLGWLLGGIVDDLAGHSLGHILADVAGHTADVRDDSSATGNSLLHGTVNARLLRLEEGRQEVHVEERRTKSGGHEQPQQEAELEGVVEGDPVQQEVGKDLDEVEAGVHDPVREPLHVVLLVVRLDGLERAVGRVHEAHEVADESSAEAHEQQQQNQSRAARHQVQLLHARGVLRLLQHRELLQVLGPLVHVHLHLLHSFFFSGFFTWVREYA